MKKKVGFTLAEVLITLTIIGVVAAITLPAINSSTGAARTRALLKKGMSTLNNAVMMNVATNEWSFADLEGYRLQGEDDCKNATADSERSMCALLNSALVGETNHYRISDAYGSEANSPYGKWGYPGVALGSVAYMITYQLSDGILIAMNKHADGCNEETAKSNWRNSGNEERQDYESFCRGFIDINGKKGPNELITCQTGETMYIENEEGYSNCTVANNPNADIFPVVFYDSTVELASNAAKVFFNN